MREKVFGDPKEGVVIFKLTHNEQEIAIKSMQGYVEKLQEQKDSPKISARKATKAELEITDIQETISREIEVLRRCNHPNIIALIEGVPTIETFEVAMEFAPLGSLDTYLNKRLTSEEKSTQAMTFAYQIACGLEALHDLGIAYCDLKSANVLVFQTDLAKLCDFGDSHDLQKTKFDELEPINTLAFTELYCPPESRQQVPTQISRASDVFTFGCVLAELHLFQTFQSHWARDPNISFYFNKPNKFYDEVLPAKATELSEYKGSLKPTVAALIATCWQKDPSKRRPISDIKIIIEKEVASTDSQVKPIDFK